MRSSQDIFSVKLIVRVTERTDLKLCQNGKTQWFRTTVTDGQGDELDGVVFRSPDTITTLFESLAPKNCIEIRRPQIKEALLSSRGLVEIGFAAFTTVRPVDDDGSIPICGFKNLTTVGRIIEDYLPDCRVGK